MSAAAASSLLLTVAGCGGGGGNGSSAAVSSTVSRTAKVSFAFRWPAPVTTKSGTRSVPESAQSVLVTITDSAGFVQSQTVNRPGSDSSQTVIATFSGLAPGTASIVFTAFTGADGSGEQIDVTPAQNVTIVPGVNNSVVLSYRNVTFTGVVITPSDTQTVSKTQTLQLTSIGYSNGNLIQTNPPGTWTSSNQSVVSVSSTGLVTAAGSGSSVVMFTDSSTGLTATVGVNVPGFDLVLISTVSTTGIGLGQKQQLTATGFAADGMTILQTNVPGTWSSSNNSILTVDQTGLAIATGQGMATITFVDSQFGEKTMDTITVVIPYASVAITPASPTVVQTQTLSLTATAYASDGATVLSTTPAGTWTSDNTAVATVDPSKGIVTGVYPGTTTIHFTDSTYGQTAAVTLTVQGGSSQVILQ